MTSLERRLLTLACFFSLAVSLATAALITFDVIDTTAPIWIGMVAVLGAYIGLQRRAANRPQRSPTRDAIAALRDR